MTRPIGLHPKILRAFDDTDAEQLLPQPVHENTRRQRMLPIREPARQCQAIHWHVVGHRREGRHQARLNLLAGRIVLPALEDERLARLVVAHDHHKRVLRLQSADLSFAPVGILLSRLDLFFAPLVFAVFVADPRLGTTPQIVDESLLVEVVEHCEQLVKLPLTDRVILVIVTTGAAQREPHPDRAHRLHAIDDVLRPPLLVERPTLGIDAMVAVEPGREHLAPGGIRQQVTGKLFHGELVVRHVVVKRLDHPVAPGPLAVFEVVVIAVTVAITRAVEPPDRHAFAKTGRLQQSIDHPAVGIRAGIAQKTIDLAGGRRQAGQVERYAPDQGFTGSRSLWRQPRLSHSPEDKTVNLPVSPFAAPRQLRFLGSLKCPVRFVNCALADPLPQGRFLGFGQPNLIPRRHHLVDVGRKDSSHQFAGLRLARHNRAHAVTLHVRRCLFIKPEIGLALGLIHPVTGETFAGEDWQYVAVKAHRRLAKRYPAKTQCNEQYS